MGCQWSFIANRHENCKLLTVLFEKIAKIRDEHFLNVHVGEVQRSANLIDLVKSFQTSIYLQNLASIQPRTSHFVFIILAASRDLIFTERPSLSRVACVRHWVQGIGAPASSKRLEGGRLVDSSAPLQPMLPGSACWVKRVLSPILEESQERLVATTYVPLQLSFATAPLESACWVKRVLLRISECPVGKTLGCLLDLCFLPDQLFPSGKKKKE